MRSRRRTWSGLVAGTGIKEASAPEVTTSGAKSILITVEDMSADQSQKIVKAIAERMGARLALGQSTLGGLRAELRF